MSTLTPTKTRPCRCQGRSGEKTLRRWMRFSPIFRLVLSSWKAIPTARFGGVRLRPGDRRAASTGTYLEALGVHAGRLKTVSYGRGRSQRSESIQGCWQKNRRMHLGAGEPLSEPTEPPRSVTPSTWGCGPLTPALYLVRSLLRRKCLSRALNASIPAEAVRGTQRLRRILLACLELPGLRPPPLRRTAARVPEPSQLCAAG